MFGAGYFALRGVWSKGEFAGNNPGKRADGAEKRRKREQAGLQKNA